MKYFALTLLLSISSSFAQQRNILLLIGDDHGNQLSCYGDKVINTPNLDHLASTGTRFANAFGAVSSCSPSRSVLLTGLYNHTNGQYGLAHAEHNFVTQDFVRSLPRLLNDAGYRTALIGKNHVRPQTVYPYQEEIKVDGREVTQIAEHASKIFRSGDEKPFFLVVGYTDPHRDFGPGDLGGVKARTYDPTEVPVPAFLPDTRKVREDIAAFYRSIDRLDQGIGLMLKALDDSGKADNTLVIYVGDNGMPFPGGKTTLYDSGIHLPMIVRVPGQKAAVVSQAMTSFIDITPTILDWTKTKSAYELPGRSMLPIETEENPKGWDTIYASHMFHEIINYYPMRAVRTRDRKLIWNVAHELEYPTASDLKRGPSYESIFEEKSMGKRSLDAYLHRPEYELYDLAKDPDETKNVAEDAAYASDLTELKAKLQKMMKQTKDPFFRADNDNAPRGGRAQRRP